MARALHDEHSICDSIIETRRSPTRSVCRDLDTPLADKLIVMYVNERTLDYGPDGKEAIRRLLDLGHKRASSHTNLR